MSKHRIRKPATEIQPENDDLAALDQEDQRKETRYRPTPIEPRDWRGEGVVGDNHTD